MICSENSEEVRTCVTKVVYNYSSNEAKRGMQPLIATTTGALATPSFLMIKFVARIDTHSPAGQNGDNALTHDWIVSSIRDKAVH